jgi:phosphoribosylformimino-5-aminoimidazole carboxamide ribotide isomerase
LIVLPAIDLRDGNCVQLVGGSYDDERVRLRDPVGVARSWSNHGFRHLHVVDLDAATGRGSNSRVVTEVIRQFGGGGFLGDDALEVQVGGGVRTDDAIERLLADGATRVVVGTRAIEDMDWLDDVSHRFPGELLVAADVRERRVVTRGWSHVSHRDVLDVVDELNAFPLAGVMVTAVHREGQLMGTDLPLMEDVAEASSFPVYASGGVTTLNDLRALADRGVAAAVVGMALYTGTLDVRQVAEEFSE